MKYEHLERELDAVTSLISNNYSNKLQGDGILWNIQTEVVFNGIRYEVVFDLPSYWKYIENGRQPGRFPNIDALVTWIRKKQIQPRNNITERQLAFLIGRKIARDGITARPYLQESIDEQQIADRLINALKNDLANV